MKQVRAIVTGCVTVMAACVAGGPGYLPQAGPTVLRFGPPRDAGWLEARARIAAWPALAMVTLPRVERNDTNQAASTLKWPVTDSAATNVPTGTVVASSQPPSVTNPWLLPEMPMPGGGWWEILTNSPVTVFATNGSAIIGLPLVTPGFTPPAEAPRSRAVYQIGP